LCVGKIGGTIVIKDSLQPMIAAPVCLLFEVMDKEPPLVLGFILYGGLGLTGYLLSRRRWWWGLLALPVIAVFAWIDTSELRDPYVGPAILREAGYTYVVGWYTVMVAGFALPIVSAVLKKASSKGSPV
jgi:hypothetical protein